MAKQNREAQLETALKTLVEACAYVSPLSGQVPMNTIKEMRLAMKFLDANAAAKELLGME